MREKEGGVVVERGFPLVGKMEYPPRAGIEQLLYGFGQIPCVGRATSLVGYDPQLLPLFRPRENGQGEIPSRCAEQPLRAQQKKIRGNLL